jgi:16S rRNA (uracil1498-N3)-methyltransferase
MITIATRAGNRRRERRCDTIRRALIRRVHVNLLRPGEIELDAASAHHVRDVLRLSTGTALELFDDAGRVARGEIVATEPLVRVRVDEVSTVRHSTRTVTIASAVPKGERADWMIEKLSELGCERFVPLATARSVVLPEGKNKRERWVRIATESAKQSRRAGVMRIDPLTELKELIAGRAAQPAEAGRAGFLSIESSATPIASFFENDVANIMLLVGPEGGWTDEELALFKAHQLLALKLTDTVLRVETAAVAAMAVVACFDASNRTPPI